MRSSWTHENRLSKPAFKLESTYAAGAAIGNTNNCPTRVVGNAITAEILIEGKPCLALLDTGATISTISHKFYNDRLKHIPLNQLHTLLDIECANGIKLPYEGYIEVDIAVNELPNSTRTPAIILVVPSNDFHKKIPCLLGTNCWRIELATRTELKIAAVKTQPSQKQYIRTSQTLPNGEVSPPFG